MGKTKWTQSVRSGGRVYLVYLDDKFFGVMSTREGATLAVAQRILEEGPPAEILGYLQAEDYEAAIANWHETVRIEGYDLDLEVPRKFEVPQPAPTQEDINDGWCLNDAQTEARMHWGNRHVVAKSTRALFRELKRLAENLSSPRVFFVNDHGNVTEYSYTGKVIGEWV